MPNRRCVRCGRAYLPGTAAEGIDPVLARRLCSTCRKKEEHYAQTEQPDEEPQPPDSPAA